jgi:hypothetical protein
MQGLQIHVMEECPGIYCRSFNLNLIFYLLCPIPRLTVNTMFWFVLFCRLGQDPQLGYGAGSRAGGIYSSDYLPSGNDVSIS